SSLKEQLLQRMSSGYSRSFISRKNGKILFHMGTTAELDNVVIGGLGLLDDSLRGQGMGKKMFGKFYNLMLSEGKKCYCFPADERADHLHRALGFKVRYTPVKLVKR
ncbi:MAG: hypothetical protein IJO48_05305, partial [Clostridia bacterium]|nr:hypothetical protein [Clostridia bacterium]